MKILLITFAFIYFRSEAISQPGGTANRNYREDYEFFWKSIKDEYSYFDKKQTNWDKVKQIYSPMVDTVSGRAAFVSILEKTIYEIYDHHANLNTNTPFSYRLVPSGTDTWAAYVNGKPTITELRKGFGTESCGIKPGMEVVAINDVPVEMAVSTLMPKSLKHPDMEAKNFALRVAMAGDHVKERKFTLAYKGRTSDFYPDKNGKQLENIHHDSNIESRLFGRTGYILINDCLYDTDLVPAFDSVMQSMRNTSSLIIDLRNVPSGGNTIVARAILSWFTKKEQFYQKHEYPADSMMTGIKRSWLEIVSPRAGKFYGKPVVVLCDHWTASLGEAIVIGFEALKRPMTKTMGTEMARLDGAVYSYEMPNSKIRFSFPAEKLYTVNGLPREKYLPQIVIEPEKKPAGEGDLFISTALKYISRQSTVASR
jgi:C-terminal processing protease CtpA/Prc